MTARRPLLIAVLAGLLAGATSLLTACAGGPSATSAAAASTPAATAALPPILFVHGNGDTAALWTTTVWRFESNGWPRDRLFAIDLPYPQARDDDSKEQQGRS